MQNRERFERALRAALGALDMLHRDDAIEALARSLCRHDGHDADRLEKRHANGPNQPAWRYYEDEAERLYVTRNI